MYEYVSFPKSIEIDFYDCLTTTKLFENKVCVHMYDN